jgi:hypothetical protein
VISSCTTSLNTEKLRVLHTHCVCFRMDLRINSSYFPVKYYSYCIYNWQWMCFLCGMDWIFVQKTPVFMFLNFAFSVISCTSLYDISQMPFRTVFSEFTPILGGPHKNVKSGFSVCNTGQFMCSSFKQIKLSHQIKCEYLHTVSYSHLLVDKDSEFWEQLCVWGYEGFSV